MAMAVPPSRLGQNGLSTEVEMGNESSNGALALASMSIASCVLEGWELTQWLREFAANRSLIRHNRVPWLDDYSLTLDQAWRWEEDVGRCFFLPEYEGICSIYKYTCIYSTISL